MFAERSVSMKATEEALNGVSIILGFRSNKTEPIPALSGAADVREALSLLDAVGGASHPLAETTCINKMYLISKVGCG